MNHSTLALLDVSGFVHAGSVNKYAFLERLFECDSVWMSQITPAGGASLIFNVLASIAGKCDIILCCDRNPVIKKEMIPGYKGNRDHKHNIEVEKQLVEYIGQQCNMTVAYADGYEADDIIYTYHRALQDVYDKILIYTSDSDLYFLVDEKTEIMPTSSRAKHVTLDNYHTISVHGANYRYNTITVAKILFGDQTDCLPPLPAGVLQLAIEETKKYASVHPEYMGDKQILYNLYEKFPTVIEQVNRVYPLDVPDLSTSISEPDPVMICNWGAAIHNKYYSKRMSDDFDVEEETRKVQDLGLYIEKEM